MRRLRKAKTKKRLYKNMWGRIRLLPGVPISMVEEERKKWQSRREDLAKEMINKYYRGCRWTAEEND